MSFRRWALVVVFGLVSAPFFERDANAQLHGDVGVNVGVMRRVKTGGFGDGAFGPVATIEAHIAIVPLIRLGVYASHDIAPNTVDGSAFQITSAGVHVKVIAPWIRGSLRAWFFAGFGYAGVYAPSYDSIHDFGDGNGPRNTDVTGAGGSFFEIPLGFGGAWRFSKPWELTAQLGTRVDFGFVGSIYDSQVGRTAIPTGGPVFSFASLGNDTLAPFLTVGIALDK
ncbi:MAG: hypothetical protein ABI461_00330 [Polyangiaceae bacterium]